MNDNIYNFWKKTSPSPDGMTLVSHTETFDQQEREEIIGFLPSFENQNVLELASGIGRFTGKLAEKATHVTSVDFAPHLIEKTRETHKQFSNITFKLSNVMDLSFQEDTFDLIFINWLFMYLSDEETSLLFQRMYKWLKKGGTLLFRESTHFTGRHVFGKYEAIYRYIDEYTELAKKQFHVVNHDIVMTYFLHQKLTNQHYWRCQKD
ncbi:MAG: methyltransferase domain-containing protein [Simkaniaceae bacterium]|nr:MAG: methyltransferase domain-containing protein [Simkaniaceae bacterium]